MPRYAFHGLGIVLCAALAAAGPVRAQQSDASSLSADELEAIFQKQKTRGLVLVQPGEEAAAEAAAPGGTTVTAAPEAAPEAAPGPAAEETPTYVALAPEEQVNIQIRFDFDSAALRDDQKPKLSTLCEVMQKMDSVSFRVVGHTDASGSASYNEQLSQLRAAEVKRHLVNDCGIAPERLEAVGVGEGFPLENLDPNADENRRVEFQALS
ncbi:OmpA family protein [Mangrovicoccus sp. HB161399]|uniref:OmpA family protein n=1 Tax=Mangrovicoccus sp. HB161399 TaxID=2720392 RepID=UPI0015543C1F|nr:OmpA family protein [Mangrovicoccus sp. HB161399]